MITSDVKKNINCPLCGLDNKINNQKLKAHYIAKCKNCSFTYSYVAPSSSELAMVYDNYDRSVNISDIDKINYKKKFKKLISNYNIKSVLDLGAGNGDILNILSELELDTYFTETGDSLIKNLKQLGHKFIQGGFYPKSNIKFDLIIMFDVIEHTNQPNECLRTINYSLKNGGLVYITTPNIDSLECNLLKANSSIYSYPEHLSYFNIRTLHKMLEMNKYTKIECYSHNISLYRFLRFFQSIKIISEKKDINIQSNSIQKLSYKYNLIIIKKLISNLLNFFNKGNELVAIYKKS